MIGSRIAQYLPGFLLSWLGWFPVARYGVRPGVGIDNGPALESLMSAVAAWGTAAGGPAGLAAARGARIIFGAGDYYTGRPWRILRSCIIEGAGGSGDFPATRLIFAAGVHGVVFEGVGTSGAANAEGIGTPTLPIGSARSDWSTIRDLAVVAAGKTTAGRHGILARVRVHIERVMVESFTGSGIYIAGDLLATAGQTANCWSVTRSRLWGNTLHGIHVVGSDANAGTAQSVDCTANQGYGFYDESSLGNNFIGCHFEGNHLGFGRVRNPNAFSLVWGGYVESSLAAPVRQTGFFVRGVTVGGIEGSPTIAPEPTDATQRAPVPIGQGATIGTGDARRTITEGAAAPTGPGLWGDEVRNSGYGWAGAGANRWVRSWHNVDGANTWEAFGKAAAQANSSAATVADLQTDFNALLAKLRAAGLMEQ